MTDEPEKKDTRGAPDFQEMAREVGEYIRKRFGTAPIVTFAAPQGAAAPTPPPAPEADREFTLRFDYTPRQVKEYLDRFVIEQEEAKKVLSIAVCDHYNHATRDLGHEADYDYSKQNVIMLGPTGVGKTYLVKCIARLIGVPFVKSDATKYSETGYVGKNVEDMVRELVQRAEGDIRLAEYGIIYIDEVDKIAGSYSLSGKDVSGAGVQRNLLKLMEETEVPLRDPQDMTAQLEAMMEYQREGKVKNKVINTRNILFIVSGAFEELGEVVRRRIGRQAVGFGAENKLSRNKYHYLASAATEDFIAYGLEPEFIGRLPVRVCLEELDEEDLFRILSGSEGSVIKQYIASFRSFGISLDFTEAGLRRIAAMAGREKTGARGLVTVCERLLRDFKYELPSTAVRAFTVDESLIDDPGKTLRRLTADADSDARRETNEAVARFARAFLAEHGIRLAFTPGAAELAGELARERGLSPERLCADLLADFPYGLRLAYGEEGEISFRVTRSALRNPRQHLTRLVKRLRDASGPGD
ncbi:MAG TPA: AAA family ATPase [bacterium]|nr:AAA family ATPase [bacterium]